MPWGRLSGLCDHLGLRFVCWYLRIMPFVKILKGPLTEQVRFSAPASEMHMTNQGTPCGRQGTTRKSANGDPADLSLTVLALSRVQETAASPGKSSSTWMAVTP